MQQGSKLRTFMQLVSWAAHQLEKGSLPSVCTSSMALSTYVLLKQQIDDLAQLVDPAQQAQNAAEAATRIADLEVKSVARIADLELKVASAPRSGPLPSRCSPHSREWKQAWQPRTPGSRRSRLVRSAASSHEFNL